MMLDALLEMDHSCSGESQMLESNRWYNGRQCQPAAI